VHDIWRGWHKVLAEYEGDRVLCAEAWVDPLEKVALWVRPDEMSQAFNFGYMFTDWKAPALKRIITESLKAFGESAPRAPGCSRTTTWCGTPRGSPSRPTVRRAPASGRSPPASPTRPSACAGRARRHPSCWPCPAAAYIYQGEELGLPEDMELPDAARQDPTWFRTHGEKYGRDGCRVPIPWAKDEPSFGFGPGSTPWLPQPQVYGDLAVDQQQGVEGSTLELYRDLLAYRRKHRFGHGSLTWDALNSSSVIAFRNTSGDGERTLLVVTNVGDSPVTLPEGDVLISSGPLADDGSLPSDTTAWVRLPVA
jgi:alpha-glucosidase